jgi:hypothetical protein
MSLVSGQREISLLTVRPGRVLTLAGPEVGAEKMRLRLQIRGPRLSSVPGRHAVARWSACGCIFTRGDDRAASRAPPSSPPLSGAHAMRLAEDRATDVLRRDGGACASATPVRRGNTAQQEIKDLPTPNAWKWKLEGVCLAHSIHCGARREF